MRKRLIPIYSVLVVAIVLLAAFVPSCTPTPTTGTIVVQATLCGTPWQGAVNYTLTLAGGTSPVSGTGVPTTHGNMTAGTWTCAYNAGGPAGAFLNSIQPSASQSLVAGGTITFTLDFELNQDAAIKFDELVLKRGASARTNLRDRSGAVYDHRCSLQTVGERV